MKMKLPQLPRIPSRKKKLRATAARRATVPSSDFDDMSEPNMKLSRALLIVLVLHIVAVAGIIAFNAIKSRQGSVSANAISSTTSAKARSQLASSPVLAVAHHEEAKPTRSASGAAKNEKKTKPVDSPLPEGAKYYTVAKGDNPVTIAKKFKVQYDDLLAANHIDDPRKLKVGQKLIIPPKKAKKS
jgi:nucleoid-associated protein YgaU